MDREHESALRRAFVDHRADYVVIDSIRSRFLIDGVNYGVRQGWLAGSEREIDEQDFQLRYRLTDAGRKHFGLAERGKP